MVTDSKSSSWAIALHDSLVRDRFLSEPRYGEGSFSTGLGVCPETLPRASTTFMRSSGGNRGVIDLQGGDAGEGALVYLRRTADKVSHECLRFIVLHAVATVRPGSSLWVAVH